MKRIAALLVVTVPVLAAAQAPAGPTTRPASRPGPTAHAVIVTGLGYDKAYSRNLLDWANRFHKVLTGRCGVPAGNVAVLTETPDPKADPPRAQATLENVRAALEKAKARLRPTDQFILVLAGHGQIHEEVGKLCLPGLDLKSDELEDLLVLLPTQRIVILNGASGGADFLRHYLKEGRVIFTACGYETEGNQAYFTEFFLQAYETQQADTLKGYGNGDGTIDLMEAYCYSAKWTADWYHRQYLLENYRPAQGRPDPDDPNIYWLVRGKETRKIWNRLYAGTANKSVRPAYRPVRDPKTGQVVTQDPLPKDLDAEADFDPKFGRFDKHWHHRRMLAETARLDDNGVSKEAFFLWTPYKFRTYPVRVHEGDPTWLARRTVLGRPELIRDPKPPKK